MSKDIIDLESRASYAQLPRLARDAISVQGACNLSGVVRGFAQVVKALSRLGITGDALRRHPVVVLWLDKLYSMRGGDFYEAYSACTQWAEMSDPKCGQCGESIPCTCQHPQ